MKEYNIYVKRPPVGEIIIYMLTYHVTIGLTALAILLDSRVRELVIKRLNVNNSFALAQLLRDVHKKTIAKFNHSIAVDAGGVVLVNMETRDGDEILTRDGVNIEAWQMVKELEVLEHMFAAAKDELCVDAGGIATEWLLTDDGVEILTRDGVNIEAWQMVKELEVIEHMFAAAKDELCVDAGGIATEWLLTNDGREILTRDGVNIEAWQMVKELEILERMFATAADELCVDARGVATEWLLTNDGREILTRDGDEIEAVTISNKLALFFKQTIDGEDNLYLDTGGVTTEWLLTNDGREILTRDGDEIEAVMFSDKLAVFFKQTIDGAERSDLLSESSVIPILERNYEMIDNYLQVDADVPGLLSQDILICSEHGIALTSSMVDMSGEQTFTLETRDGVTIETRSGIEIVAWRD